MNTYDEGNLSIHHLTEHTRASLTLPHANFLQDHSAKSQTPLSTSLSKSVQRTLQQDDFTAHVSATGGKPHVYSFVQVHLDKRLLYVYVSQQPTLFIRYGYSNLHARSRWYRSNGKI